MNFLMTAPISARFSAAFAAARMTWMLLQIFGSLGGAAAVPAAAQAHAAGPAVMATAAAAVR
jgi:hypothetical protein